MTASKAEQRRVSRRSPEVRRQDLLAVTISCLARFGARGTTGREICRQAGVSHGLLRHYFTNTETLLLETYKELCNNFLARFERELDVPQSDPWESLDRFFAALFSEEWANSEHLGAWIAFWTLVRSNSDFAQVSEAFNERLRELLRATLARMPEEGGLPHADVAAILSAVMDGLWLDNCLAPGRLPREEALALCSLTLRRLVPKR